jgi:lysophospholipase L1-like esterase
MQSQLAFPELDARRAAGNEIGKVQVVEKKGDVVVWGPTGSRSANIPRVICYGDSNTAGYYNQGRRFYSYGRSLAAGLADAGMPCEVAVCGLCSFTTQDMLNERHSDIVPTQIGPSGRGLVRMLKDVPADLVIIMTGTNDMGMSTPTAAIVQHVAQLHAVCHEFGVPTVALAPTQGSGHLCRVLRQELADSLFNWASTVADVVDCIDVEDVLPRPLGKDGASHQPGAGAHWELDDLHFSAAGSAELGQRLTSHVSSWLRIVASRDSESKPVAPCSNGKRMFSPGCSHVMYARCRTDSAKAETDKLPSPRSDSNRGAQSLGAGITVAAASRSDSSESQKAVKKTSEFRTSLHCRLNSRNLQSPGSSNTIAAAGKLDGLTPEKHAAETDKLPGNSSDYKRRAQSPDAGIAVAAASRSDSSESQKAIQKTSECRTSLYRRCNSGTLQPPGASIVVAAASKLDCLATAVSQPRGSFAVAAAGRSISAQVGLPLQPTGPAVQRRASCGAAFTDSQKMLPRTRTAAFGSTRLLVM